jgi:hypothetical protein
MVGIKLVDTNKPQKGCEEDCGALLAEAVLSHRRIVSVILALYKTRIEL